MQRFTELRIWQRGHQLALDIYRLTASFPRSEQFGITAQTRRAAISVPANIAEGAKRQSRSEYARFLNVAEASLAETEALLRLSRDLDLGSPETMDSLIVRSEELARMINAMRQRVEARGKRQL